jgi:hypothetical protein
MLEIVVLFLLCKNLGKRLRDKGRSPTGMQFLLVGLWFTGEITGGLVGLVIGGIVAGDPDSGLIFGIGGALCGAVGAAITVFQIAKAMRPAFVTDEDEFDPYQRGGRERFGDQPRRYDDYDRPTRGDGITNRPEDVPQRQRDDRIQE